MDICPACGKSTVDEESDGQLICTNPSCGKRIVYDGRYDELRYVTENALVEAAPNKAPTPAVNS